jgi:hypothetical protein
MANCKIYNERLERLLGIKWYKWLVLLLIKAESIDPYSVFLKQWF